MSTYIHHMFNSQDRVEAGTSVLDAALDRDALFEPQKKPMMLSDGKTKSKKHWTVERVRNDGSLVDLNVTKEGYHAGSYLQLYTVADAMFPNSCSSFALMGDGERVSFTQQISEEHTFADGDVLINYLMYTGSLDSSWSTACYGFIGRPPCTNCIPNGLVQMSQRRTRNHDVLLFEKAQLLAESAGAFERFMADAVMLKSIKLTDGNFRRLLDLIAPLADEDAHTRTKNIALDRRAGIRFYFNEEVDKFGSNAWSFYNAVQSYEFHKVTKDDSAKQTELIRNPEHNQSLTAKARTLVQRHYAL